MRFFSSLSFPPLPRFSEIPGVATLASLTSSGRSGPRPSLGPRLSGFSRQLEARIQIPGAARLRSTVRYMLGQRRQQWRYGSRLYLELRAGTGEDHAFLEQLERSLEGLAQVRWARYVPELERLVVGLADGVEDLDAVMGQLREVERACGYHQRLFKTHTRFPAEGALLAQSGLTMAAEVVGLSLGALVGRTKGRRSRTWTDLNALVTLLDNFPELRQPLVDWIGRDNLDVLLSLSATFSEAMTKGRSGGLLRLALRAQEWMALKARQQAWLKMEDACLGCWIKTRSLRVTPQLRTTPLPAGPVEDYTEVSGKFAMAGFSVELASTHDLSHSVAALYAAVPKPANYGRESFCLELERRLAQAGVLVLDMDCLRILDRVSRVLIDARLLVRSRYSVAAVRGLIDIPDLYTRLDRLVAQDRAQYHEAGDLWRLETPQAEEELSDDLREWWQVFNLPLSDLRLLWRNQDLVAAALVQEQPDTTVDTVLTRVRRTGAALTIIGDPREIPANWRVYDSVSRRTLPAAIQQWQQEGEVIMGLGWRDVLQGVDIPVGVLVADHTWPSGAKILTRDPMDTLWRLAIAREQGRQAAEQSVVLSKIDAFSGLILSLNKLDMAAVRRIRQATNIASAIAMVNAIRLARNVVAMPDELRIDPVAWHAMDVETALSRLESGWNGLTGAQARTRRPRDAKPEPGALVHFLEACGAEMGGPLVPVLLAGAGLSALTGAVLDSALIGAVVAINGLVGGTQRFRTESRLRSLNRRESRRVRCLRDGRTIWLEADALVPGDVILLEAGEVVPADCRLIEANHLEVDESSLTGESLPVAKSVRPSHAPILAERSSMLYEGTVVAMGEARGLVVARKDVSEARRAQYLQPRAQSGVEARLDSLTSLTLPVAALSGIGVMVAGLARDRPVQEVVGAGVSLAVAAVPEGLPLLATMVQLAAAGRLSQHGAVVRNPRAIEALGRMTLLCADKTGTLTEGALALRVVVLEGENQAISSLDNQGREVLAVGLMATPEARGQRTLTHVTDEAVMRAARQYSEELFQETEAWQRIKELPFRSERGYHATLAERDGRRWICVKGAPEVLVPLCDRWKRASGRTTKMTGKGREKLFQLARDLAGKGYRVLAVAERAARSQVLNEEKVERLVFRGFLALADPVRPTARAAVDSLIRAGVGVKIVTGDHPNTALAIARELGLDEDGQVLTGQDIEELDDETLRERVRQVRVFARVTPRHKARIVSALQRCGEVVGMTGDGANDAAAIRLADVGIALGERSTAAARSAADLLVTDGRIETIVAAVLEGRALWSSVRDAVALLVGGNLGEIGFTLLGGLLDGRSPLNARQLLLVNLLTDTVPALAVALRRPQGVAPEGLLGGGPETSLGEALTRDIQWRAGLTGGATALAWLAARPLGSPRRASSVALLALVGSQLSQALMAGRGNREVVLAALGTWLALVAIVQTPGLSRLFGCTPLGPLGWGQALTAIGVAALGARWMPEMQDWSETRARDLIQAFRAWLAEERADDAEPWPVGFPPGLPDGLEMRRRLRDWLGGLPERAGRAAAGPQRVLREVSGSLSRLGLPRGHDGRAVPTRH